MRKVAEFIDLHHSYIAKCINNNNYYKRKDYTVVIKQGDWLICYIYSAYSLTYRYLLF